MIKSIKMEVSRLEHATRLIDDLVIPIIWVIDPKLDRGYFKIISIGEYLGTIRYDLGCLVRGYVAVIPITEIQE